MNSTTNKTIYQIIGKLKLVSLLLTFINVYAKRMDINSKAFQEAIARLNQKKRELTVANPTYWEELFPLFSITDHPFQSNSNHFQVEAEAIDFCIEQLKHDGYFITPPIIPEEELQQLRACITKVATQGHRPNLAFIYDEVFAVFGRLKQVLTPILGENYQLIPDEIGGFYIQTEDAKSGTGPHRDNIHTHSSLTYQDGLPTLINVWIPLTDATTLNSCMYVIPKHADPFLEENTPLNTYGQDYSWQEVSKLLQLARAVPAPAGSILGWDTNLMHWGGTSSIFAKQPRLSLACYFQSAQVPPYHKFTMNLSAPIPFDYRLYLIEKLIHDRKLENNSFKKYQSLWHNHHQC